MFRWIIAAVMLTGAAVGAQDPPLAPDAGGRESLIEQFLSRVDPPPTSYRALRRLEARNERFNAEGWMEVTTELTGDGNFAWTVVGEGGSSYVRNKVLRRALDGERDAIRRNEPAGAALSKANYLFDHHLDKTDTEVPAGLARFGITPKRKDTLLVDGHVWLAAHDGDLLQVDGRLSKSPSFWTHTVDVMRRYARVSGVRVPVEMTSTAEVRIAGTSTFRMTYRYDTINGVTVPAAESGSSASAIRR